MHESLQSKPSERAEPSLNGKFCSRFLEIPPLSAASILNISVQPASLLPSLWGSCWGLLASTLWDWNGDRWRNPSPITLSCFSFHPSGELKSPTTQRCFQIKYRLMNWKTCPHQACLCVYLWKASCGRGEHEEKMKEKLREIKREIFALQSCAARVWRHEAGVC